MSNDLNDDDSGNRENKGAKPNGHPINGKLPDLVQAMNNVFGGPGGFAKEVKSVYDAAPNGGNVRATVMRSVLNMHEQAYRLDGRGNDLDQLSDEELHAIVDASTKVAVLRDPEKWLSVAQWAIESRKTREGRRKVIDEIYRLEEMHS